MASAALALDTSGSFCSVALALADGSVVERASSGEGDHFERLPSLVDEALGAGGIIASGIGCMVVGVGPGSFTGLRIGLSYAKGLATALRVPLQGVSSFDALAVVALADHPQASGVVVVSDARREEVFIAAYERQAGSAVGKRVAGPEIVPVSSLGGAQWDAPGRVWCSPLRDFSLPGFELHASPSLARGLIVCRSPKAPFSLGDIAALEPSYLRAVAAKTIEERRQGA